jgi:hypothetical protein
VKYELHEACAAWPEMSPTELQVLAADIKANGLHEPVAFTPAGLLLEGRHRALACEMAGVELKTFVYDGDPWLYSISKNARRRHMTTDQIALTVAKLATRTVGNPNFAIPSNEGIGMSAAEAADAAGVPKTAIESAKTVIKDGTLEEIAAVRAGKAKLRKTADTVRARAQDKKSPVQSADPIDDVLREVIAKCADGQRRTMSKMASMVGRAESAVREALKRLRDAQTGDVVMTSKGANGLEYSIEGDRDLLLVRAGLKKPTAKAEPDTSALSKSAQDRLAARMKALERDFEWRVQQEVQRQLQEILARRDGADKETIRKANELLAGAHRWTPFTREQFAVLLFALHSDSSDRARRNEAFALVKAKEHLLRPEKKILKLSGVPLSRTLEEFLARRKTKTRYH